MLLLLDCAEWINEWMNEWMFFPEDMPLSLHVQDVRRCGELNYWDSVEHLVGRVNECDEPFDKLSSWNQVVS